MQKTIRFTELFAGVGGFRVGLENVDKDGSYVENVDGTQDGGSQEDTQRTSEVGERLVSTQSEGTRTENGRTDEHSHYGSNGRAFTCVYSNENNESANAIYRRNYGQDHQDTRSIVDVGTDEIPDHDLLTAGFPCQSFSVAGQRGGFEDTRGTLFFEVARILREKRPQHFILENVKGLLSHDKGRTFNTIIGVLSDLGYRCEWELVNSKYFGVPQSRDRVFIVGHLRGKCTGRVFPLIRQDVRHTETHERRGIVKAVHNIYGGFKEKAVRVFDILPTLRTPKGGGHIPCIYRAQRVDDYIDLSLRWTTPLEFERGQAFPDFWTKYGTDEHGVVEEMSKSKRYFAMGNSVTTTVVTAIGKKLLDVCIH